MFLLRWIRGSRLCWMDAPHCRTLFLHYIKGGAHPFKKKEALLARRIQPFQHPTLNEEGESTGLSGNSNVQQHKIQNSNIYPIGQGCLFSTFAFSYIVQESRKGQGSRGKHFFWSPGQAWRARFWRCSHLRLHQRHLYPCYGSVWP